MDEKIEIPQEVRSATIRMLVDWEDSDQMASDLIDELLELLCQGLCRKAGQIENIMG